MLKSENGVVETEGGVIELAVDFAAAVNVLHYVLQRDMRVSKGAAVLMLKDAVDTAVLSEDDLKRRCIEEIIERERGDRDGCSGEGSCRRGTDEADS